MSLRGNPWDDAVAESFFSSPKKERIKKRIYMSRKLPLSDVAGDSETFYNRTRRHRVSTRPWELHPFLGARHAQG